MKDYTKIFWFLIFHTKLGHEKFDDIYNKVDIIETKKVVLHLSFLTNMQGSKMIHMILCTLKKHCLFIML